MAAVFISHRSADQQEADRLAAEIRGRGHDVWIDSEQIDIGDSIVEKIDDGLADSVFVVLCLSKKGVDSPWMSREWMSALARRLNGVGVTLLPVRLTGGDLPAILSDIKYADLTSDWDAGVNALCSAIR
ncbi:toll/interleukin-1 receptor domain-containing protein [Streptomyces sp. ID05-26A]|jgi:hypothetical protein|nr:toll/interleukin-1 receptor domain-containing protein [Streptomyces sp. ID05-26A]